MSESENPLAAMGVKCTQTPIKSQVLSSELKEKGKRGRPKGSLGRAPKLRHYKPKKWKAYFDDIVVLSTIGVSNKDIGEKFGITPTHVSNILCTQEAEGLRVRIRAKLNEGTEQNLAQRLLNLHDKALKRVEQVFNREDLVMKDPLGLVDRALKILSSANIVGKDEESKKEVNNTQNIQNNFLISDANFKQLMAGSQISNDIPLFDPSKRVRSVDNTR